MTDEIAKLYVSQVPRRAANAIKGELSSGQIKELLLYFCENDTVPDELLSYLRLSIKQYLTEEVSLEFALGLKDTRGRPKNSIEIGKKLALNMLEKRMDGLSYENAVAETGCDWSKSETLIKDAWRVHGQEIREVYEAVNQLTGEPLTVVQHELLEKIYNHRKLK